MIPYPLMQYRYIVATFERLYRGQGSLGCRFSTVPYENNFTTPIVFAYNNITGVVGTVGDTKSANVAMPGYLYTYTVDGVDSYYIGEQGSLYYWKAIATGLTFTRPISAPGTVLHLAATRII
jgi:hypothetical protein